MFNAVRLKFKSLRSEKRYAPLVKAAAFAYRHARQLRTLVFLPVATRELRSVVKASEPGTGTAVDAAMKTAFDGVGGTIRPYQNLPEIRQLLDLLVVRKPKRVLEIGTANGGTLFLLCRAADPDAKIVSVDLPGGWFGGGYPKWKTTLYQRFTGANQELHLLRADSHNAQTFASVEGLLGGRMFDFIFIDGDHTYEGVRQDYEQYRKLLAPGGVIGFHDIVPNVTDPDCQVPRFWRELRATEKTSEFVENPAQPGAGIGIVLPGDSKQAQQTR